MWETLWWRIRKKRKSNYILLLEREQEIKYIPVFLGLLSIDIYF